MTKETSRGHNKALKVLNQEVAKWPNFLSFFLFFFRDSSSKL